MQYGWLDLLGGRWLLLTGNLNVPARSWTDKEIALAQLTEEGWTIAATHPKRRFTRHRTFGYVMRRTIH